jgi:hypothetical protein
MSEKGLLTKKMEQEAAKWLDEKIKLPAILEAVDGMAFKLVVSLLDDNYGDKVPEPYKTEIRELLTEIFEEKDLQAATYMALDFADSLIDIPYFDDETEALIFKGLAEIVAAVFANMNTSK